MKAQEFIKEGAGFDVEAWSDNKVDDHGPDLIKLAKGQVPSDLLNIDDLEDGWAGADQNSRDQLAETIGGRLISVLIGYLQFSAGQKPSAEDVKDAQEVVNDPEFKKAYHSTESVKAEDDSELNRITKLAGLGEGADFLGYLKQTDDKGQVTWSFPNTMKFNTPHRSNHNARRILQALGLPMDFENEGPIPLDQFIKATRNYMDSHKEADDDMYDNVEMYDQEALRFKANHPEITHVAFA